MAAPAVPERDEEPGATRPRRMTRVAGDLELTALQQRILRLSERRGTIAVIAVITIGSVLMSIIATVIALVIGSAPDDEVVPSLIVAVIVPVLVAPTATFVIVRLLYRLKLAHERMHVLATTDSLTGVANRRRFFEQATALLEGCAAHEAAFAAMIDVDRFKRLNDSHGHAVGDSALVHLADVLHRHVVHFVGEHGVVGRLGGDEFGVFAVVGRDASDQFESTLLSACDAMTLPNGSTVSASVGIRPVAEHADLDAAMGAADEALYLAKAARVPGTVIRWPLDRP